VGWFLTTSSGPWIVIGLVAAAGLALVWFSGRLSGGLRLGARGLGAVVAISAVLLALGAGSMMTAQMRLDAARPKIGKLVDVGGYRVFVTCEGPRTGATILWLSGGYGHGEWMSPLHDKIKRERRSCLIDRPGTGWADPAPKDRSVDRIVKEVHDGLKGAGESGPLIIAGHSMGGLYAANYADAYPGDVRALILLDPTPPTWFLEQTSTYGCGDGEPLDLRVLLTTFGLGRIRALNPMWGKQAADEHAVFGNRWATFVDLESRPQTLMAGDVADWSACRDGFSIVRTPGSLGDVPLLEVNQAARPDVSSQAPKGLSPRERRNWLRLRAQWDRDYVDYTSRARQLRAPIAYNHEFPIVHADWTMAQIRPFLAEIDRNAKP
jgi:pimeloyl-ACP methyl ester carboxylesterase